MIGYYLDLARRSFRRNVALTSLMVIAIAFGVGASMTTLTVMHVLSADPIPSKSDRLFYVQLEPRKLRGYQPGEAPPLQMTRFDAEALLRAHRGVRQVMMTAGNAAIEPQRAGLAPFFADARFTSADLFPMFEVPFLAGTGWTADDDAQKARVAVLAKPLADKLFGDVAIVGKTVRIDETDLRIVGVIDDWMPTPHFYDLSTGEYGKAEQIFIPFSTAIDLKLRRSGSMNCWGGGDLVYEETSLEAPCDWLQFWVELEKSSDVAGYQQFLDSYSLDQKQTGRFERPPNAQIRDVMAWLDYREVVPTDAKLQTVVALGFLAVCLINTIGLLLTKFLRRSSEIGVRRALGASKRSIFVQLLVEAGSIGVVGGTLGLGLAYLGLWAVRHQPTQYAELAHLDVSMLVATFALAIITSVLAGLLPAWRGCQVTPAIQLKTH